MTTLRQLQFMVAPLEHEENHPEFSTLPCTDATARIVLALPLPLRKGRKLGSINWSFEISIREKGRRHSKHTGTTHAHALLSYLFVYTTHKHALVIYLFH